MSQEKTYQILDNYLEEEKFIPLRNFLTADHFPWYFQNSVAKIDQENLDDYYFTHIIYDNHVPQSNAFSNFIPLLEKIGINSLIRVKVNLYPNIGNFVINQPHIDYNFSHRGAVFYINTNNGFTILNNSIEITSIENRILFFDPTKNHQSTHCTDSKARITVNINYI
jgi:hypothetical protein